jgi:hypothetical protein
MLLSVSFPLPAGESQRYSKRLSTHLHNQWCSFQCSLCMEFSEGKVCIKPAGNCGKP